MKRKKSDNVTRVPTVGIVVMHDGQVLLVRHGEKAGHVTGSYGLPGGRIDPGESVIEAAIRELHEETGLTVSETDVVELPKKYRADLPRKNGEVLHVYHTAFAVKSFSGELQSSDETIPEWKSIDALKDLTLLVNTEDMVQEARKSLVQ